MSSPNANTNANANSNANHDTARRRNQADGPPGSPHRGTAWEWVLTLIGIVLPTAVTWFYFEALRGQPAAGQQMGYAAAKTIQFLLPIVWCWMLGRQRDPFSLRVNRGTWIGLGSGLAIAALMAALHFGLLLPNGVFEAARRPMQRKLLEVGLNSPAAYVGLGVFYSLAHAMLEEYYWRWFVFGSLRRQVAVPTAVVVSSLAFMAHHVLLMAHYFGWTSPWTYVFSAGVAIGGAFWAVLYHRSQSLLGPWLSHLVVDAAIFVIGYQLVAEVWR